MPHAYTEDRLVEHPAIGFLRERGLQAAFPRPVLALQIEASLRQRQGDVLTNFRATLPQVQSKFAQGITTDSYRSEFLMLRNDINGRTIEAGRLGKSSLA